MAEHMVLSFSLVTYHNDVQEIERLFKSVAQCTFPHMLTLVDNGKDHKLKDLCKKFGFAYINTKENIGFGAAHNIALKQNLDKADIHVIINPDVYFMPGTFEKVVAYLQKNSGVGAVVPKVLYPSGEIQHLSKMVPSPFDLFARRFLSPVMKNLLKTRLNRYEFLDYNYNQNLSTPILSGCCLVVKNEVLKEVGLFDERYFLYLEDVDLSRRIHAKYKTIHLAEASIYHDYRKASYKNSSNLKLHLKSAITYFNKWGWLFDQTRKEMNQQALQENEPYKLSGNGDK